MGRYEFWAEGWGLGQLEFGHDGFMVDVWEGFWKYFYAGKWALSGIFYIE